MNESIYKLLEELAKWVRDNTESLAKDGKSICIYIADDKEKRIEMSYAGTFEWLVVLGASIDKEVESKIGEHMDEFLMAERGAKKWQ